MKKIWFTLLLLSITTPSLAASQASSLQAPLQMSFQYVPNEGSETLTCTHSQIRDLPDWAVVCGGGQKTFTAHVIVRRYHREEHPQMAIELLYWVTAPGETPTSPRKYHSTTMFLYFKDKTDVHALTLYQGVENDQASLRMSLTATAN